MNRLFGQSKPKKQVATPTIEDTTDRMDKRVSGVEARIKKHDDELAKLHEQYKRARPGPQQQRLKQRMMTVLKQKRSAEQQRDQIEQQKFSLEDMAFTIETVKDTQDHVACMKQSAMELKKQHAALNIGDIEKMQDELQDVYDDNEEIQEILGRSYQVQDEIDDAELEAELAGLEDEMLFNNDTSYLDEALTPNTELPSKTPEQQETDPAMLEQQLGL